MTFVRVSLGVLAMCAAASCFPSVNVPNGAQLTCTSTTECPQDLVCDTAAKLCEPKGATLDRAPPFLVDASIDQGELGPSETANISFTASETLGKTPTVTYASGTATVDVPVDGADKTFTAHVKPKSTDVSGPVELTVTLVDKAKNTTTARLPVTLAFDLNPKAPAAVNASVIADRNANPIFPGAPRAIRKDSGLVVDVAFAEGVVSASLAITDAAGAQTTNAVGVIAGERAELTWDAGSFALFADGAVSLALQSTDDHGNTFIGDVTSLLNAPLLVDNTPPDPPVFDAFTRAPWGTVRGQAPTHVSGTAAGALLVLALPAGVSVVDGAVPPTVDRRPPDPTTGAFSFDIPIDVPGLTVVAVDDAGNMSAPAQATNTSIIASVIDPTSPHDIVARSAALDALVQNADRPAAAQVRAGGDTIVARPFWQPITTAVDDNNTIGASLAFDPVRNEVIAVSFDGTTTIVDGAQVKDAGQPLLPVRGGQAMAFDERRGVIVMFGGSGLDNNSTNQLFEWDGETWLKKLDNDPSDTTRPAPRIAHSMTFVPALGGVVVVDGCGQPCVECQADCSPKFNEVWLWDGQSFTALCQGSSCGSVVFPLPLRPAIGVDKDGRLVGAGGTTLPFAIAVPSTAPVAASFDLSTKQWVAECAQGCNPKMPIDPAAVQLDGELAFSGGCPASSGLPSSTTCMAKYDASGFTPIPLTDRGLAHTTPGAFQTQPVLGLPDGSVVEVRAVITGPTEEGRTVRTINGHRDTIRPSALDAGCQSAAALDGNDVVVSGGCGQCFMNIGTVTEGCTNPSANVDVINDDAVVSSGTGPAGITYAADVSGAPVVVSSTTGTVSASSWNGTSFVAGDSVSDANNPDLRAVGLVVDPNDDTRAFLYFANDDTSLDRVDAVDAAGHITNLCASNCNTTFSLGFAADAGAGSSSLFGGWVGDRQLSSSTSTIGTNGALSSLSLQSSPPPRALAAMAYDAERDASFLFGGTADFTLLTGLDNPLCGAEPTVDCGDAWAFDHATSTWTPLQPTPVLPFGDPGARATSSAVVQNGALVVTGGGNGGNSFGSDGQVWKLDVSPSLAPAHLFAADLSAEGADASGTPAGIDVTWCGSALDAAGNAAGVDVELWTPTGFVPLPQASAANVGAGCVVATTASTTPLAFAARGPNHTVSARVKPHLGTATGVGFASLTTTALEVTARFVR